MKNFLLSLTICSVLSAQQVSLMTTEMIMFNNKPAARLYWSNGTISVSVLGDSNLSVQCTPCAFVSNATENSPSVSGEIQNIEPKNGECLPFLFWTLWVCVPNSPCKGKTKIILNHNGIGPPVYISRNGDFIGVLDRFTALTWTDTISFGNGCGTQKNTEYDLHESGINYYLVLIQRCEVCHTIYVPD